jgi:prepilin-type N-terminal cleavage/methylation domain-containing protein
MVAQSPPLFLYLSNGVVVGYVRQGADDKERRWLGLTLIEIMVAMAVVAIATFVRIKL